MINYQGNNQGFNPSSPIVNNMNQQIPQGYNNMMPIGGNGYNNGSMNGYYNQGMGYGYYNPYLAEEQRKLEEAKAKENIRQQSDILKKLSRMANHVSGVIPDELMESHLEKYDPVVPVYDDDFYKMEKINKLIHVSNNSVDVEKMVYARIERQNEEFDKFKKEIPKDIKLNAWLHKCGDILYKIEQEENKRIYDGTRLYNTNQYDELIKLHKSSNKGYFENTFKGSYSNLDDMEIKLPTELKDKYSERRAKFFNSIFGENRSVV